MPSSFPLGLGNGWLIVVLVSNVLLIPGIWIIISAGWELVHQSEGGLVTHGIDLHVPHPRTRGIVIIAGASMIQWPALATLVHWPFVIAMYVRLAKRQEQDALANCPEEDRTYRERTPMFFPKPRRRAGRP